MTKTLSGSISSMPPHFGQRVGFIKAPLAEVAECMVKWRDELGFEPSRTDYGYGLEQSAVRILPLAQAPEFRDLLVTTKDGAWTAYFSANGDPDSPVNVMGRKLGVSTVSVTSIPFVSNADDNDEFCGGFIFSYGMADSDEERSIALIEGDSASTRYTFEAYGPVQPWEDTNRYTERLKRNRFDGDLIERYCRELGIDPFNLDFYSGPSVLIERTKFD